MPKILLAVIITSEAEGRKDLKIEYQGTDLNKHNNKIK